MTPPERNDDITLREQGLIAMRDLLLSLPGVVAERGAGKSAEEIKALINEEIERGLKEIKDDLEI